MLKCVPLNNKEYGGNRYEIHKKIFGKRRRGIIEAGKSNKRMFGNIVDIRQNRRNGNMRGSNPLSFLFLLMKTEIKRFKKLYTITYTRVYE